MSRSHGLKTALKARLKTTLRPAVQRYGGAQSPLPPELWGLRKDSARGLVYGDLPLHDLLGRWGSPLHVVLDERLRENARKFTSPPPRKTRGCEVFYSYKSNPVPKILSRLHDLGVGAEVISAYELWLARKLGVPPEKIVYNGPAKSPESVRDAVEMGVGLIGLNHREEIATVGAIAQQVGKRARVAVRVVARGGWSAQFGVPMDDGAALEAFREAASHPWLHVVGIHAHRGGMVRDEPDLEALVANVLSLADELREKLGLSLEILDFGGSLGLPTVFGLSARDRRLNQTFQRDLPVPDPARALTSQRYVALLLDRVDEHHRQKGLAQPRVFVEPGRAMTGDTQLLLASVLTTKQANDTTYAVLDAGINLAESVRSEYHQLFSVNRACEPPERTYTLVGPICSPADTLYSAVRLPALRTGDSLAIMDAGAYFVPFSTSFSFPRPAIVSLDETGERLLRRAERFEDLVVYDEL